MGSTLIAIEILNRLLMQAANVGALLRQAQSEGRDITPAELDGLVAKDDAARNALAAAIAARKP